MTENLIIVFVPEGRIKVNAHRAYATWLFSHLATLSAPDPSNN